MFLQPKKEALGGVSLFLFLGIIIITSLILPASSFSTTPLKSEIEDLETRVRHRTLSWQIDIGQSTTTYNLKIMNLGHDNIYPPLRMVISDLSSGDVSLQNPDGQTAGGDDYIELQEADIPGGVLEPGEFITDVVLVFNNPSKLKFTYKIVYYGFMEAEEESNFSAMAVTPMSDLSGDVSWKIKLFRLDRARGGVDCQVQIKNNSSEIICGPSRLLVDSTTNPLITLSDNYGEMNGYPYVVIGEELTDGVLQPGESSDNVWLFFDNPTRLRFNFTTQTHGFKPYYYDISSRVLYLLEDLGVENGVRTLNLQVINKGNTDLEGPVRVKVNQVTINGNPVADAAAIMETKTGVLGGVPYQMVEDYGVVISKEQAKVVQMRFANPTGDEMGFELQFEGFYRMMDTPPNMPVTVHSTTNDTVNHTTTYTVSVKNENPYSVAAPIMLLIDDISDSSVTVANAEGTLQGKPFVKLLENDGELVDGESTTQIDIVFNNPNDVVFTPTFVADGTSISTDVLPPETTCDYLYDNQWVNNPVTLTLTAVDPLSGVKETRYSINGDPEELYNESLGIEISTPGVYTVSFYSIDNLGNTESTKQVIVKIDQVDPVTGNDFTSDGVWVTAAPVIINFDPVDDLSDIFRTYYEINSDGQQIGDQVSISADGQYTVSYYSVDNAGNEEDLQTLQVLLDSVAPETNDDFDGQVAKQSSTITLTPSDATSGVKVTKYSINGATPITGTSIFIVGLGEYDVTYWSEDNAGNTETAKQIHVVVQDAPNFFVTSPESGFTTKNATVNILGEIDDANATIVCNGISGTIYQNNQFEILNVPLEEGEVYYSIDAENQAGFKRTVFLRIIKDTVPPEIEISSPEDGLTIGDDAIDITGSVGEDYASAYIKQSSGQDIALTLDTGNAFTYSDYPLEEGANEIVVYAVDSLGNSGRDEPDCEAKVTVISDLEPPSIDLEIALYDESDAPKPRVQVTSSDETYYNQVGKLDIYGHINDLSGTVKINNQSVTVDNDGKFQKLGLTIPLTEGQEGTVSIVAKDEVQNINSVSISIIKDTTGPEIFITSFTDGDITNDPAPQTVEGVARGTDQVTVDSQVVNVVDERFSYTGWNLVEGTNELVVSGSDTTGNETSVTMSLILDTQAPVKPVITYPDVFPFYTNNDRIQILGTVEPEALVEITGGALDVEVNADISGNFTKNVFLNSNSVNSLNIFQTDQAENTSQPKVISITQDMVKPTVQLISPTSAESEVSQIVVTGSVDDNKALDANVVLEEYDSTDNLMNTYNATVASGVFTFTVDLGEGNYGDYYFKLYVSDLAGNTKIVNIPINYIEVSDDFDGPEILVISPENDSYVNNSALTISGTCRDRSTVVQFQIDINGGGFTDIPAGDFDNDALGAFSHTVNLNGDATYTITLRAKDGSVNVNESQVVFSIILDTTPPMTAPLASGVSPGIQTTTGVFLTNADYITVIGSYEPGYTVRAVSSVETAEAEVNSSGVFQLNMYINTQLDNDTTTVIEFIGIDLAGNLSTDDDPDLKSSISVINDPVKPTVTSILPIDGETNVALDQDITVDFSEPIRLNSLTGSQGNRIYLLDELGTRYDGELSPVDGTDDKQILLTLVEDDNGGIVFYPDSSKMTIVVEQGIRDVAGNSLPTEYSSEFYTLDDTPPDAPIITDVQPGYITNVSPIQITGTAEANAAISVFGTYSLITTGTVDSSGNFTVSVAITENAVSDLYLTAQDISGNESDQSNTISISHDNVPPVLSNYAPLENEGRIARNSVFELIIDSEIAPSTVEGAFSITSDNEGAALSGTRTLLSNNGIPNSLIRFAPADLLIDGDTVTLSLNDTVTDLAGNQIDLNGNQVGGVMSIVYTIEDAVAPLAPTITSVSEESPTNASSVDIEGLSEKGATILILGPGLTAQGLEVTADPTTGVFQATVPLAPNEHNVLSITATDDAGNTSPATTKTIICDQIAPEVSSIMPAAGSDVPINGLFKIVFNEELDTSTLEGSIKIMQNSNEITSTLNINDGLYIVTLNSVNDLDEKFPHSVVINTNLTDKAGNPIAEEITYDYEPNDSIFPDLPTIMSMSETSPTKNTSVNVIGFSASYDITTRVKAVNGSNTVIADAPCDATGYFDITFDLVENRMNSIYLIAYRQSGNESNPYEIQIVHDTLGPEINILAPLASITLPTNEVTLIADLTDASEVSSCLVNGEEKIINVSDQNRLNALLAGLAEGNITITVTAMDILGNVNSADISLSVSSEDPDFEMNPPIITIIQPENGIDYDGQTIEVIGTAEDASELSLVTIDDIAVSTPATFPTSSSYFRGVANLVDGLNDIVVKAWDSKNNMSQTSVSVNVDIAPPSVSILSPENGAIFTESSVDISGRVTDSNGIASFTLNQVDIPLDNEGNFTISYNLDEGENVITFVATDVADNVVNKSITLYYDVIGPTIVMFNPADGEDDVVLSIAPTVVFDENIDPASISTENFKVFYLDSVGDEVKELTGNVVVNDATASFNPTMPLEIGATYRMKLFSGITDLVGFPLQATGSSVFTISSDITTIYGLLIDAVSYDPIENAKVSIVGTDIYAMSNKDGNFVIQSPNIPVGDILLFFDGTTAYSEQGIKYIQSMRKINVLPNQYNSIQEATYLPQLRAKTVEFVAGNVDQDVTFNDTVTGALSLHEPEPDKFNMHIPAGSLEFPDGTMSGNLSGQIVREAFLPNNEIPGFTHTPVSTVWFHPFGVKCLEPVHVTIPFPNDRGETGIQPGYKYLIVSYSSETCEWEEVGYGYASDDALLCELEAGKGLTELTIAGIIPWAIEGELETELRAYRSKFGQGASGEQNFGLMELIIVMMLLALMSSISIKMWRMRWARYALGESAAGNPAGGIAMTCSDRCTAQITGDSGIVTSFAYFPVCANLIALLVCMSMDYPVCITGDIEWNTMSGHYRAPFKMPIFGMSQNHSAFGWAFMSPVNTIIDSWGLHGNVRYVGDSGQAEPNHNFGSIPIEVWGYTDAPTRGGIVEGDPITKSWADEDPYEDPTQFAKSFSIPVPGGSCFGLFFRWSHGDEIPKPDGSLSERTFFSHIQSGSRIRYFVQYESTEKYVGESYTTAPSPYPDTLGVVRNVDIYGNVTIGKLNIDCYTERKYERKINGRTQIISQMIPYNGLVSVGDDSMTLHTGTTMATGDRAPDGNYNLYGKLSGAVTRDLNIPPNSATPWHTGSVSNAGKYKVEVSPKADFTDKLYINLKAQNTDSTGVADQPPQTAPSRGRGSSRGDYTPPSGGGRTASRRTPTQAASSEGKKDYTWLVVGTIMHSSLGSCEAIASYDDWSDWLANGDPNNLFASVESRAENIFALASAANPTISMDSNGKVTTKVEIKLNDAALDDGAGIVFKLTQSGTPYLIGRKLVDNFVQCLIGDDNSPTTSPYDPNENYSIHCDGASILTLPPQTSGTPYAYMMADVQGKTVTIDIIPAATAAGINGNNIKIIKYIDYIEANFDDVFDERYWTIEIIDKNTMIPEEGGDINGLDDIYSQLERLRVDIN